MSSYRYSQLTGSMQTIVRLYRKVRYGNRRQRARAAHGGVRLLYLSTEATRLQAFAKGPSDTFHTACLGVTTSKAPPYCCAPRPYGCASAYPRPRLAGTGMSIGCPGKPALNALGSIAARSVAESSTGR